MTVPDPNTYTGLYFDGSFNDDFLTTDTLYRVTLDPVCLLDLAERPQHPPYSPLWRRFRYPQTPCGLFLWKDGRVVKTDSWYRPEALNSASLLKGGFSTEFSPEFAIPVHPDYQGADDMILGGHIWYAWSDSWQAKVLTAAGYPLIRYEGNVP